MFGQVFIGHIEPTKQLVLVKSLQNTRDETALAEFKRELDMFHRLAHENVSKLVGLCRESDPHYLILENTDWVSIYFFMILDDDNSSFEKNSDTTKNKNFIVIYG